jgi:hypothetical protein
MIGVYFVRCALRNAEARAAEWEACASSGSISAGLASQEARAKRRFWTLGRGRAGACGRQSASVGGGYGCTSAGGKPGQRQIQGTKGNGLAPRASDENPRREPLGNSPVILSFTFLLLDGNYNSKNCEVKTIGKICREICRRVIV